MVAYKQVQLQYKHWSYVGRNTEENKHIEGEMDTQKFGEGADKYGTGQTHIDK